MMILRRRLCTNNLWRAGTRGFHGTGRVMGLEDTTETMEMYSRNNIPDAVKKFRHEYGLPYSPESYRQRTQNLERTKFQDLKIVKLSSGKGGNGRISFFRDANRATGPPDGGDGGKGGDVYVQAVEGETSLNKIRFHYKAEDGRNGGSSQLAGKNGNNLLLQVPVGTVIKWIPDPKALKQYSGHVEATEDLFGDVNLCLHRESFDDGEGWLFKDKDEEYHLEREYFMKLKSRVQFFDLISRRQEEREDQIPVAGIDLDRPGEPQLLLRGGRGGMGNMHFQTPTIRNPRFAKRGRGNIEEHFLLELKLIADLGLVGLPNAGKSTLLGAISRAQPRVGHWEFTTLNPTVGTISTGIAGDSFTVADIPGIVEGAEAEGKGLGLDFLRHVERSGGLVFIVALDRQDPVSDLQILTREMGPARMKDKNVLVVATKANVDDAEEKYKQLVQFALPWKTVPCCAQKSQNVQAVINAMAEITQS